MNEMCRKVHIFRCVIFEEIWQVLVQFKVFTYTHCVNTHLFKIMALQLAPMRMREWVSEWVVGVCRICSMIGWETASNDWFNCLGYVLWLDGVWRECAVLSMFPRLLPSAVLKECSAPWVGCFGTFGLGSTLVSCHVMSHPHPASPPSHHPTSPLPGSVCSHCSGIHKWSVIKSDTAGAKLKNTSRPPPE